MEKVTGIRLFLATVAGAGIIGGCAPRVTDGENVTTTKDTSCLQCPGFYSAQNCQIQENYGTVPAGIEVTVKNNGYNFNRDGNWIRVNPHYLKAQKALISHEGICWVNGNDLKK